MIPDLPGCKASLDRPDPRETPVLRGRKARQERAKWYEELLRGSKVKAPTMFPDSECVWHCYVIEVENRERVRQVLDEAGIETGLHYPVPLHLQQAYQSLGYKPGDFPVSEGIAGRCISMPLYPELSREKIEYISDVLKRAACEF